MAANFPTTPDHLLVWLLVGLPFLWAFLGFPPGQVGPRSCPCSRDGVRARPGQLEPHTPLWPR